MRKSSPAFRVFNLNTRYLAAVRGMGSPKMIIWLNLLAFGGLEAVFLWPLVLGLYWQKANSKGAISGMIVGGVSYALLASFKIEIMGFHAIVPSLLFSLIAFIIGNLFGKNPVQSAPNEQATPAKIKLKENNYALDTTQTQLNRPTSRSSRR